MDTIKDEFIEHGNHRRADAALEGVLAYERTRGYEVADHESPEPETDLQNDLSMSMQDLVTDLMHLADRERVDWTALLSQAAEHYAVEQTKP